jgi:uncharacterized protein YyaL (SSP411 family)
MDNKQLNALLELDRSLLPPDGGSHYNRLIFSRSPYLLQHADNPTDWWEWGEDAFAEARRRGVPLFVSIGYATCHWCHVMARESFADEAVASFINRLYVPVKVDREERPDLDEFYMTASRLLSGNGGWPLNLFVDHDKRPFFATTYLPKEPRDGVPGFTTLLQNISVLWNERPQLVINNASGVIRSMNEMMDVPSPAGRRLGDMIADGYRYLRQLFDQEYAGFGSGPKFPLPVCLLFLLTRGDAIADAQSIALKTLYAMIRGGINDQLAGGMHRYATDRSWQIPHFEKMLYDQALLVMAYGEGYRVSHDRRLLETACDIARFVLNELALPEGGFCAALDADSDGVEGLFYTWTPSETQEVLGEAAPLLNDYWGVTETGNLEGRSVLHLPYEDEQFALSHGMDAVTLTPQVATARELLLAARNQRKCPLCDPKVICAWNGLMIAALARLSDISGDPCWRAAAEKSAAFVLENMVNPEGRLLRSWLGTPAPIGAFAEDYACFCLGLSELASSGTDSRTWKEHLRYFGGELLRLFVERNGNLSAAGLDAERLPVPISTAYDAVIPSAAAITTDVFVRMWILLDDGEFTAVARRVIDATRGMVERNPAACLALLMAEESLEKVHP